MCAKYLTVLFLGVMVFVAPTLAEPRQEKRSLPKPNRWVKPPLRRSPPPPRRQLLVENVETVGQTQIDKPQQEEKSSIIRPHRWVRPPLRRSPPPPRRTLLVENDETLGLEHHKLTKQPVATPIYGQVSGLNV
ncbi:hypothetical protein U1Q18_015641 [Sarracenia purpurea var. burkii]